MDHPNGGGAQLLPALPQELLDEFVRYGTVKTFPKHSIVVVEGEPAEVLYLILDGSLMVYVDDEAGRVAELTRLGPGQYFGELMLASAVRTASVRTMESARLCLIRRSEFEKIISLRPDLAFHVVQTLIARVVALTESVRGLVLMDVYGRVAKLLRESAEVVDGRRTVSGMSQQAIAERVGASKGMINRILKDLTVGGYIATSRASIEIRRGLPKHW